MAHRVRARHRRPHPPHPRLIIDLAEDLAQEALVAALEQWPQSGVPDNPAAWLTASFELVREVATGNAYADWVRTKSEVFRSEGIPRFVAGIGIA